MLCMLGLRSRCVSVVQLSGAAQLLGGAFHVGSLADAAAVGPALQALTTSALPHPLLATLASPRIKASQQVLLTVPLCSHILTYAALSTASLLLKPAPCQPLPSCTHEALLSCMPLLFCHADAGKA